jgi:hypothetical protein
MALKEEILPSHFTRYEGSKMAEIPLGARFAVAVGNRTQDLRPFAFYLSMVKSGRMVVLVGSSVRALESTLKWGIPMWGSGKGWALGLTLAAPIVFVTGLGAQSVEAGDPPTAPTPQNHRIQKPVILPPMPSGPLSQLPMDQIPAIPAKISYQGGLLAISAQNATLGDILREVRRLTGATIEIPAGAGANERVVTSLGPGAPRDVLAILLNGSSFNYVMVGSNSDPAAVASVVLMPKPAMAGEMQPAPTVAANYETNQMPHPGPTAPVRMPNGLFQAQPVQPGVNAPPEAEADDAKDDDQDAADDADDQAQPGQPGQPDATGQAQPDPNQPNAGPKTPEQILEMLRRQQQQQNQPPGAFPPPGQPPPGQQQN